MPDVRGAIRYYGMEFLLLSGMRYIKGNEITLLGNGHETTNTIVKKRPFGLNHIVGTLRHSNN